ncbi:hypothetical protein [Williamsia sp.]|uniref:hypothetical protein n=1 Tax=Williamsia sp. TaxID=1872085 RepID=UPI002F950452
MWRFDEEGRRKLTLRMIFVRIRHLPHTSALAIDSNDGQYPWTLTDHLIADLWALKNRELRGKKGKDHPGRPKVAKSKQVSPERQRSLTAARRRLAARRRAAANFNREE